MTKFFFRTKGGLGGGSRIGRALGVVRFLYAFANYGQVRLDLGGLEFTQSQKGLLMGVGTGILFPRLDRRHCRFMAIRKCFSSPLHLCHGFHLHADVPQFHRRVHHVSLSLAVGAALFKPIVSATVSRRRMTAMRLSGLESIIWWSISELSSARW